MQYTTKKANLIAIIEVIEATLASKVGIFSADYGNICRVFGYDTDGIMMFETVMERVGIPKKPNYSEFSVSEIKNIVAFHFNEDEIEMYFKNIKTNATTVFDYGYTFQTWLPVPIMDFKDALERGNYFKNKYIPGLSESRQPIQTLINFLKRNSLRAYIHSDKQEFDASFWSGKNGNIIKFKLNHLPFTLFI